MSTFLQDFTDKMYTVPNSINRYLRLIRFLDKRVQNLQKVLAKQQRQFIAKMTQLKDKDKKMIGSVMQSVTKDQKIIDKNNLSNNPYVTSLSLPLQEIINQYENIIDLQKEIIGYAKEKTEVGSQLTHEIHYHQSGLQKEMKSKYMKQFKQDQIQQNRLQQMTLSELSALIKNKKQKDLMQSYPNNKKKEQFLYDPKQDKFCYCGEPSYGDMVQCQNIFCQRQWFHISCIQQAIQSDKSWFCTDCQKLRDKTRSPISRSYYARN